MNSGEDDLNFVANDLSIKDLRNSLINNNEILLEDLKARFTQELLASMVFFVFNEICKNKDSYTDEDESIKDNKKSTAQLFFSAWREHTKKQSKKEILEINNQLKDEKMFFLNAISNFSLPSTEDYQSIYDKAIAEIQRTFEKNTSPH